MGYPEPHLEGHLSFRLTQEAKDIFLKNVESRNWTKDSFLRELVDAFNKAFKTDPKMERPIAVFGAGHEPATPASFKASAEVRAWIRQEIQRQMPEVLVSLLSSGTASVDEIVPRPPDEDSNRDGGRKVPKTFSTDRGRAKRT